MDQDPFKLPRAGKKFGVEQNAASRNLGGSQVWPQRTAEFHADGTAGERRQHSENRYWRGGTAEKPPGCTGAAGALKKSGSLITAWYLAVISFIH